MKPSEPALVTQGTCFQLVYHYFGRWILSTHTGNVKKYVRLVKSFVDYYVYYKMTKLFSDSPLLQYIVCISNSLFFITIIMFRDLISHLPLKIHRYLYKQQVSDTFFHL